MMRTPHKRSRLTTTLILKACAKLSIAPRCCACPASSVGVRVDISRNHAAMESIGFPSSASISRRSKNESTCRRPF